MPSAGNIVHNKPKMQSSAIFERQTDRQTHLYTQTSATNQIKLQNNINIKRVPAEEGEENQSDDVLRVRNSDYIYY